MGLFTKQPDEYTVKETAAVLGVSENAIRNAIQAGTIKATKRGRYWYIKKTDLQAYIKSRTKSN